MEHLDLWKRLVETSQECQEPWQWAMVSMLAFLWLPEFFFVRQTYLKHLETYVPVVPYSSPLNFRKLGRILNFSRDWTWRCTAWFHIAASCCDHLGPKLQNSTRRCWTWSIPRAVAKMAGSCVFHSVFNCILDLFWRHSSHLIWGSWFFHRFEHFLVLINLELEKHIQFVLDFKGPKTAYPMFQRMNKYKARVFKP